MLFFFACTQEEETFGLVFDHNRVDHSMVLDKTEVWTICNPTGSEHPFHIHQNSVEVLSSMESL